MLGQMLRSDDFDLMGVLLAQLCDLLLETGLELLLPELADLFLLAFLDLDALLNEIFLL